MGKHKRDTAEKEYTSYGICGSQSGNEIRISPSVSKVGRNLIAHIVCQNIQRRNELQIKRHASLNIKEFQ